MHSEGTDTDTDTEYTAEQAAGLHAARRMFDADQASAGLGIELVELAPGRAVARMRVTPAMLNGHAIGHGGYVFLLADTAFALACNSHGPVTVAAGADVSFLAPVTDGDLLTARAVERVAFGRSGLYDVTVTREAADAEASTAADAAASQDADTPAGQIVAEFRGRSRVVAGR